MKERKNDGALASDVVDELGGMKSVCKLFDIKPPSVAYWKKAGLPKPWYQYLKYRFSNLRAWRSDEED